MAPAAASKIPQIPGTLVSPDIAQFLNEAVAILCALPRTMFPGSQPVSFGQDSLTTLEEKDFWVCEKSDGVRVLVYIAWNVVENRQDVFLIDRNETFHQVTGMVFPNGAEPGKMLRDTIFDGELVIDTDSATGKETLRLYAFDLIVFSGQNLSSTGTNSSLLKRYGRLKQWVTDPLKRLPPNPSRPFDIVLKTMQLAYGVATVFEKDIPNLQHGHDGLIFTCCETGYMLGTDPNIMKWKPPSENSVDFKLELMFPALASSSSPDYSAMPIFRLHQWLGEDKYEFFDTMTVSADMWAEMKASKIQYDDQIVEVTWDADKQTWVIQRVRDDKPHGNHAKTVGKILQSILDGVEKDQLFSHCRRIRETTKAREQKRRLEAQQLQHQQQLQQQHQQPQRQQYPPQHGRPPNSVPNGGGGGYPSGLKR